MVDISLSLSQQLVMFSLNPGVKMRQSRAQPTLSKPKTRVEIYLCCRKPLRFLESFIITILPSLSWLKHQVIKYQGGRISGDFNLLLYLCIVWILLNISFIYSEKNNKIVFIVEKYLKVEKYLGAVFVLVIFHMFLIIILTDKL